MSYDVLKKFVSVAIELYVSPSIGQLIETIAGRGAAIATVELFAYGSH